MVFGLWNVRVSKLPTLSGRDCIRALGKVGFYQKRRESRQTEKKSQAEDSSLDHFGQESGVAFR